MATRRSTRATSKGPSEVSVAPSATPKTPRRGTRSNAGLPAVGTRTSNAYGTNAVAASSRAVGPEVATNISGVLDNLLHPDSEITPARKRRGTSQASTTRGRGDSDEPSTIDRSRSFNNESGIFGEAYIESSVHSPNLSNIQEDEEDFDEEEDEEDERPTPRQPVFRPPPPTFQSQPQQAQRKALEEVARADRIQREDPVPRSSRFTEAKEQIQAFIDRIEIDRELLFKYALAALGTVTVLFVLLTAIPGTGFHNYGLTLLGMKHNIGQFVPFRSSFSSADARDLRSRMWKVEQEIVKLQQRPTLDNASLKKLHDILPEALVVKKNKNGGLTLPNGLWSAIHDKIQSDPTLVFSGSGSQDGAAVSTQVDAMITKSAEKFFRSNEFKGKVIDGRFSHLLQNARNDELVVSRAEAIDLIRDNWEIHQQAIKAEIATIQSELERVVRQVSKLEDGTKSLVEIENVAKDVFNKVLPNAQLDALSKVNLRSNLNYGYKKINHFSPGTGAVVNARLVSPNFEFAEMQMGVFERRFRAWFLDPVPLPNPPSEALRKWEEHGDCWCTPVKDDTGFGSSLAVIMGSNIYPDEVVVEHIPTTAALEPGSAPKEMELLAWIPRNRREDIEAVSNALFAEEAKNEKHDLPTGYVRVATWTYDISAPDNVQAFDVQLDMKAFDLHTNKLIVRVRNNWGSVDYTCLYRVRVHGEVVHTPGIY